MHKYPECDDCYFNNREPAICDNCEDADQYEPEEGDNDAMDVLRRVNFYPNPNKRSFGYDDPVDEDALNFLREAA